MKSVNEQRGRRGSETPRDARVRRTRRALHDALGSLLHESPFESIAIKQILARAEVARATFYAHFDSKEALLASAVSDVMEGSTSGAAASADPMLRFALPLLEHIGQLRVPLKRGAPQIGFHRKAHGMLHQVIREFVSREMANGSAGRGRLAASLVVNQVASTFMVVLEWWLTDAPDMSAREVHDLYALLVSPALRSATG